MGDTNKRDLDAVSAAFEEVEEKERKAEKEKAEQRDREKKKEKAAEEAVIDQVAEEAAYEPIDDKKDVKKTSKPGKSDEKTSDDASAEADESEKKSGLKNPFSGLGESVRNRQDKSEERSTLRARKKAEHYRAVEALKQARVDARSETLQKKLKAKQDAQEARAKARQDAQNARTKAKQDARDAKAKAKLDAQNARVKAKKDARDAKERQKQERRDEKHARWVANRPKRIKRTVITVVVLGVVLGGGGYIYGHYYHYYTDHFYHGVSINGTDVTYKTADEVKQQLAREASDYKLTIREKGGKTETLTAKQLGWKFSDDGQIDALLSGQDPSSWVTKSFQKQPDYKVKSAATYSQSKLTQAISGLECLNDNITKPENAYLEEGSDGKYKIVKEVEGNQVDEKLLTAAIKNALDDGKTSVNIVKTDCYVHPTVTSDDETLKRRERQWNRILGINISYEFGKTKEVITGDALRPYVTDNGEKVTLSYDWVRPEVIRWASKYNTFEQAATFVNHAGKTVSVPAGGDYGWYLDVGKTAEDLEKALRERENGTRDPKWAITAQGWDNGGLTGTYVEISLSEQKLYLYKSGSLLMSCDIVTGAPGADTQTRCGIFSIDKKETSAAIAKDEVIGADSSSDEADSLEQTKVRYLISYDGTRGIRDASWRSSFGGAVYQSAGTLGSIDVSKNDMKTIYSNVKDGTPVVVYDDSGAQQLPSITVVSDEEAITDFNSQESAAPADGQTDSAAASSASSEPSETSSDAASSVSEASSVPAEAGSDSSAASDTEASPESAASSTESASAEASSVTVSREEPV